MSFVRSDRSASAEQINGNCEANQTRQSLCSAVSWDNPKVHFRLAKDQIGTHHTSVAGHRDLSAPAENGAIESRHNRLFHRCNLLEYRVTEMTDSLTIGRRF